jgi:hypothetical protein
MITEVTFMVKILNFIILCILSLILTSNIIYAADSSVNRSTMFSDKAKMDVYGGKNIKMDFDKKTGILTATSSVPIINATIDLPNSPLSAVSSSPKLYIKEKSDKSFKKAEPYCKKINKTIYRDKIDIICDERSDPLCVDTSTKKISVAETITEDGPCFNQIELTSDTYKFNVEHFTDYYVQDGNNFGDCLTCCMEFIYGTDATCVISQGGNYSLNNDSKKNFTDIIIKGQYMTDDTMIIEGQPNGVFGGLSSNVYVGYETGGNGIIRGLYQINNQTLRALNGDIGPVTFSFKTYFMQVTNNMTVRLYRVASQNWWAEDQATWNNRLTGESWYGSPGLNQSGVDYLPWASGDPEINFTAGVLGGIWYTLNIPSSWIQEWANGSMTNNGMLIKIINESTEVDELLTFYNSESGDTASYFNITLITDVNVTVRDEYQTANTAITVASQDVNLNCNNKRIIGSGAGSGIFFNRAGDNITIKNCNIKNYLYNLNLDGYDGALNYNIILENITTFGLGSTLNFANINATNIFMYNTTSAVALVSQGLLSNFDNMKILDSSSVGGFSLTSFYPSTFNNLEITGHFTDYCINNYLGSSVIFKNLTLDCGGADGIYESTSSNSNITAYIRNVKNGVTLGASSIFKDSSIYNASANGVYIPATSDYSFVMNNTINLTGNIYSVSGFFIGNTTYSYGGNDFDLSLPILVDIAVGVTAITSNDFDISLKVTGSNNFSLCLIDIPLASLPMVSVYIEQPNTLSCAAIATAYGGTSYLDEQDFLLGNILANYSIKNVAGLTVKSGANPPYLRYSFAEIQNATAIIDEGDATTIHGNTLYNSSNKLLYSLLTKGSNAKVSLNNFYFSGVLDTGTASSFCEVSQGNFYEQSLTPPAGDCGPLDTTLPRYNEEYSGIMNMTWKKQDSNNIITYYLDMLIPGYGWQTQNTTLSTNLLFDTRDLVDGQYELKITPFDGSFNGTVNHSYFRIRNTPSQQSGSSGGAGGGGGDVAAAEAANKTQQPAEEEISSADRLVLYIFDMVSSIGKRIYSKNDLIGWAVFICVIGLLMTLTKISKEVGKIKTSKEELR